MMAERSADRFAAGLAWRGDPGAPNSGGCDPILFAPAPEIRKIKRRDPKSTTGSSTVPPHAVVSSPRLCHIWSRPWDPA